MAVSSAEQASSAQAPSSSVTAAWPSSMSLSLQPAGGRRAAQPLPEAGFRPSLRMPKVSATCRYVCPSKTPGEWPHAAPPAGRQRPPGRFGHRAATLSPRGPARRSASPRRRCGGCGPPSAVPSRRHGVGHGAEPAPPRPARGVERLRVLPHTHEHLLVMSSAAAQSRVTRAASPYTSGESSSYNSPSAASSPPPDVRKPPFPPRMRGLQLLHASLRALQGSKTARRRNEGLKSGLMPKDYFGEAVAAGYDESSADMSTRGGRSRCRLPANLARRAPRWSSASVPAVSPPLAHRGVHVHGIDLSEAMVARLPDEAGCRAVTVTIGDFATTTVDGRVLGRLPGLQHDHEPDDPGRAGRLLPNVAAHLEPAGAWYEVMVRRCSGCHRADRPALRRDANASRASTSRRRAPSRKPPHH